MVFFRKIRSQVLGQFSTHQNRLASRRRIRCPQFLSLFLSLSFVASLLTARTTVAQDPPTASVQISTVNTGFTSAAYSSMTVGEVDGNAANGEEIIVTGQSGDVAVFGADGTERWRAKVPPPSCGDRMKISSTPALGTLYGDGVPYVVVTYGVICDGGIAAFRGTDGARKWNFNLKNFSKKRKFLTGEKFWRVWGSPALADTDGDGSLEIGFGAWSRNVYLLEHTGTVRMMYHAADTVWSSPAFSDTNLDGRPEMIIGTDISENRRLKPPTKNGGNIYALQTNRPQKLIANFREKTAFRWMTPVDQVVWSSPVVGDVLPNSPGAEVIVRSGCIFKEASGAFKGRWIKVLRPSDGKVLKTIPTAKCTSTSVALADVDSDGTPEIIGTDHVAAPGAEPAGCYVRAWRGSGEVLWGTRLITGGCADFRSPVVSDLDGNGSPEVVLNEGGRPFIVRGSDGAIISCNRGLPCAADKVDLRRVSNTRGSPAVRDLDGDSKVELVINGSKKVFVLKNLVLDSPSTADRPYQTPWPMYQRDSAHSGAYAPE